MDFLTTARLLMDIQAKRPDMQYDFIVTPIGMTLQITMPVDENVPDMFESAAKMFEPA